MKFIRSFVIFIIWFPFELLYHLKKQFKAYISPTMFEEKPLLHCDFSNQRGAEAITLNECRIMVDGQLSPMPISRNFGILLPRILQINEGIGFYFDPIPLVTKARELGQKRFEVCAWFQDGAGRIYVSKSLKIYTDEKRFIRLFENQPKQLPEPLRTIVHAVAIPFFYLLMLIFPDFEL